MEQKGVWTIKDWAAIPEDSTTCRQSLVTEDMGSLVPTQRKLVQHPLLLDASNESRKDAVVAVFGEDDVRILNVNPILEHHGLCGLQRLTRGAGGTEQVFSF
ncbi:MAG: hypothetical protein ACFE9D_04950 [Promethearchaeota archaeon]